MFLLWEAPSQFSLLVSVSVIHSVMSDSSWPHKLQSTNLLCPWNYPGKNTGVSCHFLLQVSVVCVCVLVTQLCPTLCDPMDCSSSGSSVHGILQARILEWVSISFSSVNFSSSTLVTKLCLTLATPQTVARQVLLSLGFSRQEYWSGLPFPSPSSKC